MVDVSFIVTEPDDAPLTDRVKLADPSVRLSANIGRTIVAVLLLIITAPLVTPSLNLLAPTPDVDQYNVVLLSRLVVVTTKIAELPSFTEPDVAYTEYVGVSEVSYTVITGDVISKVPEVDPANILIEKLVCPSVTWSAKTGRVIVAPPLDVVTLPLLTESLNLAALAHVPEVVQYNVVPSGILVVVIVNDTEDPSPTADELAAIA